MSVVPPIPRTLAAATDRDRTPKPRSYFDLHRGYVGARTLGAPWSIERMRTLLRAYLLRRTM